MSHPTHVCIQTSSKHTGSVSIKIKKGDYVTLVSEEEKLDLISKIGYKFKEDLDNLYDISLFLPLPPPMIKYVKMDEEFKEAGVNAILEEGVNN